MDTTKCLFDGCESTASVRGLCGLHYRAAHLIVKSGKVTWEQLEGSGKCEKRRKKLGVNEAWFLEGVK